MNIAVTAPTRQCQGASGMPWTEQLPAHWTIRRLRSVVEMRVSNVDKHTNEDEIPVRMCNYVDVYYHDRINSDLPYMKVTASYAEAERFRLKRNDVVITKDSETWDDIAVPALVTDPPRDLICGYHLAILRPTQAIEGAFLARALQTRPVAQQFHVKAQGITRYGLSHDDILSTNVPLPPLEEQTAIVRYLDHADDLINRYISAKERLIALLEEQRQAVIHQAVTRGLDPNVQLKPSAIPWIGDVPAHWNIQRLNISNKERIPIPEPPSSPSQLDRERFYDAAPLRLLRSIRGYRQGRQLFVRRRTVVNCRRRRKFSPAQLTFSDHSPRAILGEQPRSHPQTSLGQP